MKTFAALFVGIILGFAFGGIAPNRAILQVRAESEAALRRCEASRETAGPSLLELFAARAQPPPGAVPPPSAVPPVPPPPGPATPSTEPPMAGPAGPVPPPPEPSPEPPQGMRLAQEFDDAVTVQRARAAQMRAVLTESAHLSDVELTQLDSVVQGLTEALQPFALQGAALLVARDNGSPREMLAFAHGATGALEQAQSRLDQLLGPERAASVPQHAREVWQYLDLEGFRPALAPLLQGRAPQGNGP